MKPEPDLARLSNLLPHGTLSFADCIQLIESDGRLTPSRRRDMASALRRLAKALGEDPQSLHAALSHVQPRVARLVPAQLRIKPKTWQNILSNARAAFEHCGQGGRLRSHLADLSPDWQGLWKELLALNDMGLRTGLRRFVTWLDRSGIRPEAVTDADVEAYHLALVAGEIVKDAREVAAQARYAWNRAVRRVPGWPERELTTPRSGAFYGLPLDHFPASFRAELDALRSAWLSPDPLDPKAPARPLRPATVKHQTGQITRIASALVHAGLDVDRISSLSVLTERSNVELAFRWLHNRFGAELTRGLSNLARSLDLIVEYHSDLDETPRQEVRQMLRKLQLRRMAGMTDKNRERLQPLTDPVMRTRLYALPDLLWEEAVGKEAQKPYKASLLRELSLALSILSYCPIRLRNLVELDIKANIRRIGRRDALLFIAGKAVKNGRTLEYPLSPEILQRIDQHVAKRSGVLCPAGTLWLFPRRDGAAPLSPASLGNRITAVIRERLGIAINAHLYRHLGATVMLEHSPGSFDMVRLLLGHSHLSNTIDTYAGLSSTSAAASYARQVEDLKRKGQR
jgi:integrase